MKTLQVKFKNRTADNEVSLKINIQGINHVLSWYGAYYSGDDYEVYINGTLTELDLNGERVFEDIEDVLYYEIERRVEEFIYED